jgi:transposase InsO family protein
MPTVDGGSCEACMLGKMHRVVSRLSNSRADAPLELLHSDVCRPFQVLSLSGKRYMLTILDDHSKYSCVRFVAHKSDVAKELQDAIVMYEEGQLGCPAKRFRSDGGGEYVSNSLQSFLCSKGIIVHEKSPPYHPQQNSAAERLNRTLVDRSRAMMLGAQLPLSTWAEVLNAACFLRNCTPCSSIDWDLPPTSCSGKHRPPH